MGVVVMMVVLDIVEVVGVENGILSGSEEGERQGEKRFNELK